MERQRERERVMRGAEVVVVGLQYSSYKLAVSEEVC